VPEYEQAVYVISVAAELAGVHPQTLRIYERKGLVAPGRTRGGSRRYSPAHNDLHQRHQEQNNEGLSLAGVKRVLELENEVRRLREEVAQLHRQYRRDLVPVSPRPQVVRRPPRV
jgi:MerR family transcriptional regulator/heat shock protein HspR